MFIFRLFTYFFRGLLFPLPSPPMYRHDSCLGMEGKKYTVQVLLTPVKNDIKLVVDCVKYNGD